MKSKLLPLLALPFLFAGCEHIIVTQVPKTPPPVQLADRSTAWGELPAYDRKDQFFVFGPAPKLARLPIDGTVTLELLVNRDGTVKDAVVIESSGIAGSDVAAMELYRNARYTLKLGASDPAPYVVEQRVVMKTVAHAAEQPSKGIDYGRDHYYGPTYADGNRSGTSNTVNGFVR